MSSLRLGIEPLLERLSSLQDMAPPRNPKEVKQFLGLAGYYRSYTKICWHCVASNQENILYEWTTKCLDSFDLLKKYFTESFILKYPDPWKPYMLFTDTNTYAWACVLTQTYSHIIDGKERILHPIIHVSGSFQHSYINWAILTKEVYAVYMSV